MTEITKNNKIQTYHEKVPFRLIQMPCCNYLFCNVNHRFPSYCINCGTYVYDKVKQNVLIYDNEAWLKYKEVLI